MKIPIPLPSLEAGTLPGDYVTFIQSELLFILAGLSIIIAWVASGAFSSSIAEIRRRGPVLHFVMGLILPVLYPLAIFFVMSPKTKASKKEQEEKEDASNIYEKVPGAPPVEGGGVGSLLTTVDEEQIISESSMSITATVGTRYDKAYFRRIARDENGSARGPFLITMEDGQVRAEHILDTQDKLVIVERIGSDGKSTKLRIPYEKVENCVEI